jgi:hypothetical protein
VRDTSVPIALGCGGRWRWERAAARKGTRMGLLTLILPLRYSVEDAGIGRSVSMALESESACSSAPN